MRTISLSLFLLFAWIPFWSKAQNGQYTLGARAGGVANTSVTLADAWSLFNNVGALTGIEQSTIMATYQNRYRIAAFNTFGAGYVKPMLNGVAGISVFRFGDDLFNEQKLGLSFSNKFGVVSLGATINYLQINMEGLGTKGILIGDFGGLATITDQLVFGAHISNINQAQLSSFTGEKIPTIMRAGLSYRPIKGLMLNTEVEKNLDFDALFKIGLEYKIMDMITVRTGIITEPFESAYGIGFTPGKIIVDYAYRSNPDIGDIHELSVSYKIKSK